MDYPFVENSSKTINLIFQAFPYLVSPYQGTLLGQPTHMRGAAKKLWVLVRFKALGVTQEQLLSVYQLRIRATKEFDTQVFHSSLTKNQSMSIEMVEKKNLLL